ncbi:MAG: DNA-binding protein [Betaproteobacteria bacterium]|nr:DNA-binding protein [Betaproteobacteria bacterium]
MDLPPPVRTDLTAPYWDRLQEGVLTYQRCRQCGHAWLPARTECPACLHDQVDWVPASGRAHVVSWVVFHMAYHKAFERRLPYNVAIIELEEGPRLISNVLGLDDPNGLQIDQPVLLRIEREGDFALPRFVPA